MRVTYETWPLSMKQTFDRHMSTLFDQPSQSGAAFAAPFPSPPPSFTFWLSFHFSRCQYRKSPSSVFLCSETKRKRLLRRLHNTSHMFMQSSVERPCNTTHHTCYVYYRLKRVSTKLSIWLLPCEPWLSSVAVLLALLPKGKRKRKNYPWQSQIQE